MISVIGQATCQLREARHPMFAVLSLLNKEVPLGRPVMR